jgi:hypothetical protein
MLLLGCLCLVGCQERKHALPERIRNADHQALANACRELILKKDTFTNDWKGRRSYPPGAVVLDTWQRPSREDVPSVIRDLQPSYIMIGQDRLLVYLSAYPRREALFVFAQGVAETGSIKLADGLWFYGDW